MIDGSLVDQEGEDVVPLTHSVPYPVQRRVTGPMVPRRGRGRSGDGRSGSPSVGPEVRGI